MALAPLATLPLSRTLPQVVLRGKAGPEGVKGVQATLLVTKVRMRCWAWRPSKAAPHALLVCVTTRSSCCSVQQSHASRLMYHLGLCCRSLSCEEPACGEGYDSPLDRQLRRAGGHAPFFACLRPRPHCRPAAGLARRY